LDDIKIPENVFFTGALKGEELQQQYRTADVFCLPSIEEGQALVLGEALSFGIPIVATTNTGVTDIIVNGKEGFVVPIRDAGSIAEKLQLLSDDSNLLNEMRQAASLKGQSLQGWSETGKQLIGALSAVHMKNK
jgi:glycosyltransferase involved in cell wall biosynthesis